MGEIYTPGFAGALAALKDGRKVTREGWNGKGMFLYLVPAASYAPGTEVAKEYFNGADVPYHAYIAIKTAQEEVVPWVASHSDLLAEDWQVL